jgi:hypothetical protein
MDMKDNEKSDEKKETLNIYTPLSIAKEEIWKRWNDKELRKKVEDFLEGDIPEFLKDEPKAYFANQIISPNFDYFSFIDGAKKANLSPVCPEFLEDKFVSKNSIKRYLGKINFYDETEEVIKISEDYYDAINIDKSEGEKISQVETLWGEKLADFHHRILYSIHPESEKHIFEISSWMKRNGKTSKDFYFKFLALFICNSILFENFLPHGEEGVLTNKIVLPNFLAITEIFGVKPLIVTLQSSKVEKDVPWGCYHNSFRKVILDAMNNI